MRKLAIQIIAIAMMAVLGAAGLELQAASVDAADRQLPRGWYHRRALRAYDRKQLALRDSIVRMAESQLGVPYVLGGASPEYGFDCSGLVRWVYSQIRLRPPRTAKQQARIGMPVDTERLRPGDLLTFGIRGNESHIGIYIGNGRFVHASSVAQRVIVSRLDRPRYARVKPFSGGRTLLFSPNPASPRGI
jgi:hypothetical protein